MYIFVYKSPFYFCNVTDMTFLYGHISICTHTLQPYILFYSHVALFYLISVAPKCTLQAGKLVLAT